MEYLIGQKVKVNIGELSYGSEHLDELFQGETGEIVDVNDFVYPYQVKLDDTRLNKILSNTPRQFSKSELEPIGD